MTTTPGSLVARAIDEARTRRRSYAQGGSCRPQDLPQWTRRDTSARKIAVQLVVPSDTVEVIDDHVRWTGLSRSPGDLITITDPVTSQVVQFVPDFASYDRRWLLIDECPECGGMVPMALVTRLADVGDYLDPDNDNRLDRLPADHFGDPAHRSDCSHRKTWSHRD